MGKKNNKDKKKSHDKKGSKFKFFLRKQFKKFDGFVEKNNQLCEKLNRSQKYYYVGLILAVLTFILYFIAPKESVFAWYMFTSIILSFGIISDLLIIYKKIWETNIGKGVILIIYAIATNLAYAFASMIINEIVMFESSTLTYSLNLVAIMLIPMLILLLSFIIFGFFILISHLYMAFIALVKDWKPHKCLEGLVPKKIEAFPFITFFARLLIFIFIIDSLQRVGNRFMPSYGQTIEDTAKFFIYNFEAKKYSRCEQERTEKVIPINDNEIVVVEKNDGGYKFTSKLCISKLKKP